MGKLTNFLVPFSIAMLISHYHRVPPIKSPSTTIKPHWTTIKHHKATLNHHQSTIFPWFPRIDVYFILFFSASPSLDLAASRAAPFFTAPEPALHGIRLRIRGLRIATGSAQDGVEGHDAGLSHLFTPAVQIKSMARWQGGKLGSPEKAIGLFLTCRCGIGSDWGSWNEHPFCCRNTGFLRWWAAQFIIFRSLHHGWGTSILGNPQLAKMKQSWSPWHHESSWSSPDLVIHASALEF